MIDNQEPKMGLDPKLCRQSTIDYMIHDVYDDEEVKDYTHRVVSLNDNRSLKDRLVESRKDIKLMALYMAIRLINGALNLWNNGLYLRESPPVSINIPIREIDIDIPMFNHYVHAKQILNFEPCFPGDSLNYIEENDIIGYQIVYQMNRCIDDILHQLMGVDDDLTFVKNKYIGYYSTNGYTYNYEYELDIVPWNILYQQKLLNIHNVIFGMFIPKKYQTYSYQFQFRIGIDIFNNNYKEKMHNIYSQSKKILQEYSNRYFSGN